MSTIIMFRVLFFWILVSIASGEPILRHLSDDENDEGTSLEDDVRFLKNSFKAVTRQVMLQQFFTEERVRSEGQSGLKQVRMQKGGLKNYFSATAIGGSAAAVHDHANNIRTVGMGEFVAVLNGIEFRTRHNDYRLYKPSKSNEYHAVEEIPFPKVPEEVTNKTTVEEQVEEMRQFFLAWRDQNPKHRDYTKYFKPVLCYLEGAWTKGTDEIDEPFHSDRHFIDAKNWYDLMDKVRFTSYTGSKSRLENFSFLPTKFMGVSDEGLPNIVQWNYRIVCHELKKILKTSRLRPAEDLKPRVHKYSTPQQYLESRRARFQINPKNENEWFEKPIGIDYLDDLMAEIPGKDNYGGQLDDNAFDANILDIKTGKKKVISNYHRWFKIDKKDAMGLSEFRRGFSDESVFMAATSQEKVASMSYEKCNKNENCEKISQRFSYAIPLEIIYLTPLLSWNPYGLEYKGESNSDAGRTVTEGGNRNCNCDDKNHMLNGTNSRNFYMTPVEFFNDNDDQGADPADTAKGTCCVLDTNGNGRTVMASGTRIVLPDIPGVGKLRTRYPIFPIHGEGSSVWKELNALREVVMKKQVFERITLEENEPVRLRMRGGDHTHELTLTAAEVYHLKSGPRNEVTVTTTETDGHTHTLVVRWDEKWKYTYRRCDNEDKACKGFKKALDVIEEKA